MHHNIEPLSLKVNTLWNSVGCLLYLGCQWLITVLVVVLSAGYQFAGELAIAMAVGNIFAPIALFRVRTYQVSDITNKFSSQNYIALRAITIVGAFLLVTIYCLVSRIGVSLLPLVMVYLVFKADETFSDVLYGIDQRRQRMDYIGVSQGIRGVLSIMFFSLSLVAFNSLLVAVICMAAACMAVTWLYDIPHARRFGRIRPALSVTSAFQLLKTCFPAALSFLCCNAVISISRQYFGFEYGEYDLGIYAAVATPAIIIQVSASYLYFPAISRIAELFIERNKQELVKIIVKLSVAIFIVMLVLCLIILLCGDYALILLYGISIAPYTNLLLPICIVISLLAYFCFLSEVLIIFRSFFYLLFSSVLALLACFLLVIPLISNFGMNGLNVVLIVSYSVGLIVASFFVVKKIKAIK